MEKPNRNEKCTCGSGKKYKMCCGQSININTSKTKTNSEIDMNAIDNIPANELVKSLRDFIQNETIDFTLFVMGETDYTYFNITHQCVENLYNQYHQELSMDFYLLIYYLGHQLNDNRYENEVADNLHHKSIFFLYALCHFLQSSSFRNFKGIIQNRTIIITFFKNKKGYYTPNIIGTSLDHPSSPLFLVNAYKMIKLCVSRRKHIYDSLAVDLIVNRNF
jgi:hypothetical protein